MADRRARLQQDIGTIVAVCKDCSFLKGQICRSRIARCRCVVNVLVDVYDFNSTIK